MILPEARQIGTDAVKLLRPAWRRSKPGDHLVEDEQGVLAIAQGAQALEESRLRQHDAHVSRDRLDEDGSNLLAVCGEERLDRGQIVVAREQGVTRCP